MHVLVDLVALPFFYFEQKYGSFRKESLSQVFVTAGLVASAEITVSKYHKLTRTDAAADQCSLDVKKLEKAGNVGIYLSRVIVIQFFTIKQFELISHKCITLHT